MNLKLGKTSLTNTDKAILGLLRLGGTADVNWMVRRVYSHTRQPEKKAETFTRRLRRLQRFGMVRDVGGLWMLEKGNSKEAGL